MTEENDLRAVALDSNLLTLWCVGRALPDMVGVHKRLRAFTRNDLLRLRRVMSGATRLVILPYALAEVSNLLDRDPHWQSRLLRSLREIAAVASEPTVQSVEVLRRPEPRWLGLTDTAWLHYLEKDTLLLSTDRRLVAAALQVGRSARLFESKE